MAENNIPQSIRDEARTQAREVLSMSESFKSMGIDDQRSIYQNLVNENLDRLSRKSGLSGSMANEPGKEMGFGGFDPGMAASVDAFEDLVDSVDFPAFVGQLMKSVFDANINVMKKQTDDYIRLMKEATKSVADFVKKVKDDDAFANLAETKPDMYNLNMGADGSLSLADPSGGQVDPEDAEVKKHLMDVKIQMAKEHRAALREVILMGVTRLVVDKGEIDAAVLFEVTAKRHSDKTNKNTNINTTQVSGSYGGGLSSLFGGPSANFSTNNTNINVSTSNKTADDTMSAKLSGHVNIKFKTDYFKLDNFMSMYGDGGVAALKPAAPAGAAPALPSR